MHAWKSLSRCVSQAGHIPTSVTFHSRYYTNGADPSPSISRRRHTRVVGASQTPEQKEPSLSETLRKLNRGNDSRKKLKAEPRRPVVNPIPYMDPGLDITAPLKQALGKLPQPQGQDFPSTSILSTENWAEDAWKSAFRFPQP